MKSKVIVIVGPTASGKTALSIELAKKINGEIISADSMQVYKEMDIGTAKVTKEESQGIKHYLIDIIYPNERYTVSSFCSDCKKAIEEILAKGKVPIVVGGTGLYITSLTQGIQYPEMEFDENYRNKLMSIAEEKEGLEKLWEKANRIDPEAMKKISKNDKKRIVRVLEIYNATGKTKTEIEILSKQKESEYDFRIFGISMERTKLYDRINRRVDCMIEQGLEEEVRKIVKKYEEFPTAMQGLGYKEVLEYFYGEISYDEMIEKIKQETRRYAKRQLTWFKKDENIMWLDSEYGLEENINTILEEL